MITSFFTPRAGESSGNQPISQPEPEPEPPKIGRLLYREWRVDVGNESHGLSLFQSVLSLCQSVSVFFFFYVRVLLSIGI